MSGVYYVRSTSDWHSHVSYRLGEGTVYEVTYHCLLCGAKLDTGNLTLLIPCWRESRECPSCGRSVLHSVGSFSQSWALCFGVYGLLVSLTIIIFIGSGLLDLSYYPLPIGLAPNGLAQVFFCGWGAYIAGKLLGILIASLRGFEDSGGTKMRLGILLAITAFVAGAILVSSVVMTNQVSSSAHTQSSKSLLSTTAPALTPVGTKTH